MKEKKDRTFVKFWKYFDRDLIGLENEKEKCIQIPGEEIYFLRNISVCIKFKPQSFPRGAKVAPPPPLIVFAEVKNTLPQ